MLVMVGPQFTCIRLVGRANFASSIDFRTLISELRQKGYGNFVLDLSECVLMDSTFLGGLAGIGLEMSKFPPGPFAPSIKLFNPSERISELLENLGVLYLFQCCQGTLTPSLDAPATAPSYSPHSQEEVTRACLEAHQVLMALKPENITKFRDVTQFLAEDLKKLQSAQVAPSAKVA